MRPIEEVAERIAQHGRELLNLYDQLRDQATLESEKALIKELESRYRFVLTCLDFLRKPLPPKFDSLGVVIDDDVNVRKGPSGKTEIAKKVDRGLPVIVLGTEGNWVHVQLPDGTLGCIFKGYVSTRV